MADQVINEVIAVEKELQAHLDAEKLKCEQRVEKAKRESEEKIVLEEAALKESSLIAARDARIEAEAVAAHIMEEASARATRIERIGDELLSRIIARHIIKILPGRTS